jgi:ankyrin repeat protein
LPLHLCVNRETPSLPVIRALVDIYANAVKTPTSDMQGSLPLHLCVNRDRPHFEAVALLVALHPDGIRSVNSSNQTALHR